MQIVVIDREPVELYKILKFAGFAQSGAHAKIMIENGEVLVNGMPEDRKRRKMLHGDQLLIGDIAVQLQLEGAEQAS
jgi:ribosome-associated protein